MEHQAKTTYYLNALDPKYKNKVKWIKGDVSHASDEEKKKVKAEIRGYFLALEDAGIINHTAFRCLYNYYTLNL